MTNYPSQTPNYVLLTAVTAANVAAAQVKSHNQSFTIIFILAMVGLFYLYKYVVVIIV
jgi:hypothetical protein